MSYSTKIVLDSVGPNEARLTTFEFRYPRMVHAELMTHRMLSRNSASSRAIPTEKLLKSIEEEPAGPVWWGKNQSGMQAREELTGNELDFAKAFWNNSAHEMIRRTKILQETGIHKQIANRMIEPWMWITVLVTATELDNAFALRDHADAQPEIAKTFHDAQILYNKSVPQKLYSGQWHLPLVTGYDEAKLSMTFNDHEKCLISTGRCARVSYLTHEGVHDPNADIKLATERLAKSGHMSPFEHVAKALTEQEWRQIANKMAREWIDRRIPMGNFWGWLQLRKTLENEHNFRLVDR